MIRFLKNQIPMQAEIRRCWLFTFQVPEREVRSLIPNPIELVTHRHFAFWNVVVARMGSMRPQGVPALFGMDYWHVGYRLYTRVKRAEGDFEGLSFLRSDCDQTLLTLAGNLFTDFCFHTSRIQVQESGTQSSIHIHSNTAKGEAFLDTAAVVQLPIHSAFDSLEEAEAFLKYKPCGISGQGPDAVSVVRIRRDEDAWRSKPVAVLHQEWAFLKPFQGLQPELCFEVAPIHYQFGRGQRLEGLL